MKLNQLVVFSILMENDRGILSKAPPYILEKFQSCGLTEDNEFLLQLLDDDNQRKFREWLRIWQSPDSEAKEQQSKGR